MSSVDVKEAIEADLGLGVSNVDVASLNDYGGKRWAVTRGWMRRTGTKTASTSPRRSTTSRSSTRRPSTSAAGRGPTPGAAPSATARRRSGDLHGLLRGVRGGRRPRRPARARGRPRGPRQLYDVDVSKHFNLLGDGTYTTAVTFSKVNAPSPTVEGAWVGAPVFDLGPLTTDAMRLYGTAAAASTPRGRYDADGWSPPPWSGARRPRPGAGVAYVYGGASWLQDPSTSGPRSSRCGPTRRTTTAPGFGQSAALVDGGGVAAVGAPYAEDHGLFEKQNVTCGDAGSFKLGLFGFWTEDIPHNASAADLQAALWAPTAARAPPPGQHKCEHPNVKGSYLGRFPLVLVDFGRVIISRNGLEA